MHVRNYACKIHIEFDKILISKKLILFLLDYEGYDELYSDSYEDGLIQGEDDADWKAENCAITCGNGHCIMKNQICDAKRDCLDGKDEMNCSCKYINR